MPDMEVYRHKVEVYRLKLQAVRMRLAALEKRHKADLSSLKGELRAAKEDTRNAREEARSLCRQNTALQKSLDAANWESRKWKTALGAAYKLLDELSAKSTLDGLVERTEAQMRKRMGFKTGGGDAGEENDDVSQIEDGCDDGGTESGDGEGLSDGDSDSTEEILRLA